MLFGLQGFTLLHIAISLIAIAIGFTVIGGFFGGRLPRRTNMAFLATTIATNVTGLMFPFGKLLPSHVIAILSLVVLAVAVYAFVSKQNAGGWRTVYVVSAVAALYLNVFVLVAQTFMKNPALIALAPTQSEGPFLVSQLLTLAAFIWLGSIALARVRS